MVSGKNQLIEVKGTESRIRRFIENDKIDAIDVALVRGLSTIVYTVVSNKTNPLYVRLDRLADEKIVRKEEKPYRSARFYADESTSAKKLLDIIDGDYGMKQEYYMGVFSVMSIVLDHMETNDRLLNDISHPINKTTKKLLRTGYDKSKDHIDFHVLE